MSDFTDMLKCDPTQFTIISKIYSTCSSLLFLQHSSSDTKCSPDDVKSTIANIAEDISKFKDDNKQRKISINPHLEETLDLISNIIKDNTIVSDTVLEDIVAYCEEFYRETGMIDSPVLFTHTEAFKLNEQRLQKNKKTEENGQHPNNVDNEHPL